MTLQNHNSALSLEHVFALLQAGNFRVNL